MSSINIGSWTLEHDREWRAWRLLEDREPLEKGDEIQLNGSWVWARWIRRGIGEVYRRPVPLPSIDDIILKSAERESDGIVYFAHPITGEKTESITTAGHWLRTLLPGYEEQIAKKDSPVPADGWRGIDAPLVPTPKKPGYEPAATCYASALGVMREKARELGYALAIHGSMRRDFDIVAVPWVADASDPEVLVAAIQAIVGGFIKDERMDRNPGSKPHGRLAWSIHLGGGPYIDLSVMPRVAPEIEPMRVALVHLQTAISGIPVDDQGVFAVGEDRFSARYMLDEISDALTGISNPTQDLQSRVGQLEQVIRDIDIEFLPGTQTIYSTPGSILDRIRKRIAEVMVPLPPPPNGKELT